ncbi:AAA family ATPase [Cyanobium sp. Candia 9D4]|uniref:GumC family protein n=1 Tax=Cyanobium sp. Candia 9D4 TaxID=2823707 RepID=UPI0020CCCB89|nr:polysaccharide biosynthesis tyrosine autokinase [Cyanobium sp. Candia 9D4]MCP9932296.1 AAA family ATPase [Cyanobium sp. Candia 9D4]
MAKSNYNEEESAARPVRIEGTADEFILIPKAVEPQAPEPQSATFDVGSLISILKRQLPLALGVLITTVGVGAAVTLYQRLFLPVFEGSFSLLVGDPVNSVEESSSSDSGADLKGLALQSSRVPNIQISQDLIDVLASPLLLQPVSKQLGISEEDLTESLIIERRSGDASSVLDITLKWNNPKEGEKILKTLMNDYLSFSTNQRREKLAESISYLNEQAPALQNKLSVIQGQLSDFRIRNKFLEPTTEGDAIVKQLDSLKERQDELLRKEAELKALGSAIRAGNVSSQQIPEVEQRLSTAPSANGSVQTRAGTGLDQLQIDLSQLEKELAIADATFKSSTPLVQSLKARISRVKALLQRRQLDAIDATLQQISGEQAEIKRQRSELEKKFRLNPTLIKQNDAIQQRLEVAKANLTAFIKAREDIRLLVAQRTIPWKVISPPLFQSKLVSPNIARNLALSILLGLSLGGVAAFLREKIQNVYHTPKEVEQSLRLSLLGSITFQPKGLASKGMHIATRDEAKETKVLRESLRNLYASLRLLKTDKGHRLIGVTSTIQGEGKSTLTALFAQTLSDLGKRVLVVDADLRQPILHTHFGFENVNGLSTLLSEVSSTPEDFIQMAGDRLHLLTAGPTPSDPANLLVSERCAEVIETIRALECYDYVLFDVSPSLDLSDPLLITENIDGFLFIVSLGLVHRELPAQALIRIQSTGTPTLGIVSNEVVSAKAQTIAMLMRVQRRIPPLYHRSSKILSSGFSPKNV